jgi:hypothetical protein
MALDPEEVVTLTDHGTMKLRSAVVRAMMLPPQERNHASILRSSEPSILDFHLIKHLATRWDGKPHCLDDSEVAAGAFYLKWAGMMMTRVPHSESTAFPDSASNAQHRDAAGLQHGEGWSGAPQFRQLAGWQTLGEVSCYSS